MITTRERGNFLKNNKGTKADPADELNAGGVAYEMKLLKKDVIDTVNESLDKVDNKLNELSDMRKEHDEAISTLEETTSEIINHVRTITKGERGEKGESLDEQAIENRLLAKIPKIEELIRNLPTEESITARVLKGIPEHKPSLQIIKESLDVSPETLLEKLISLGDKFKLKVGNIEGLQQTIQSFSSQITRDKGYVHGGGDTVAAGTGISIATTNGVKIISATGSIATGRLAATGTVDDSNVTFTFTQVPSAIVINGALYFSGTTVGGVTVWTNVGTTITLAFPVGTGGSIVGIA